MFTCPKTEGCMFDGRCVVDMTKKMLGHFHNPHLASHSLFDPGCPRCPY